MRCQGHIAHGTNWLYHLVLVSTRFTQPRCINREETSTSWYNLYISPSVLATIKVKESLLTSHLGGKKSRDSLKRSAAIHVCVPIIIFMFALQTQTITPSSYRGQNDIPAACTTLYKQAKHILAQQITLCPDSVKILPTSCQFSV